MNNAVQTKNKCNNSYKQWNNIYITNMNIYMKKTHYCNPNIK